MTTAQTTQLNKTISISSKNQITIPRQIMEYLGFEKEARIKVVGNSLLVTPVREESSEFSEYILADLIKEGYSGDELLEAFKNRQRAIKPAIQDMIEQVLKGKLYTHEEVFGVKTK
ncbi:MAG: AbrB family transcriptional regulator [Fusobacteriaceae bacterium]|nr:AbrB family transcriptional regulator [Fusobacteriaceae bacterium]